MAPNLSVVLDAERLARHGVSAGAVLAAIQTGYAGHELNRVHVGNRALPVVVLLDSTARGDLRTLAELPVTRGVDGLVRLRDVADIVQTAGRYNVLHRNGQRLQVVTAEVAGRDLDGFVRELRQRVFAEIVFPQGMHAEFSGAAIEQAAARKDLLTHALMAGLGVLLLIYMAVGRVRYLVLILFNLPFSLAGGVVAVMLNGGIVSVGSIVGFVTLFGITVRNSIMLVSHYDYLVRVERAPWDLNTLLRGARERLPAILMTALVTALAMLPLTIDSDNPGREIMGPMAAIIIGGLISSTLLNLLVMPALLGRYGDFARSTPSH